MTFVAGLFGVGLAIVHLLAGRLRFLEGIGRASASELLLRAVADGRLTADSEFCSAL